jgi:L-lactate dehydrogenase complex protein LldF
LSTAKHDKFLLDSERVAFDLKHRATISFNMSKYYAAVDRGRARYTSLQLARKRAANIKRQALSDLDTYLLQFEKIFTENGGIVLWAKDTKEAMAYVSNILKKNNAKVVVKSKSMTTEEIHFNEVLEEQGIESVETDLGEYIVQLAGEKPYHIVTPAMHKSKKDVAILFNEKFGMSLESTPEEMTALARKNLRNKYLTAEVGITGANFIVADIGAFAVTENEGNALMSTSFPKIHIAIAGIEKVIPSVKDLALMWPHLALNGTGQAISVYNTLFSGPKRANDTDGPEQQYIILLDNGRTDLYAKSYQNQALSCIRCGACLNACPIYKNVGGYTYETTYQGPIGTVITPHLKGLKEHKHLTSACSLCGNCSEVCPVKIPLHNLILNMRSIMVENNYSPLGERIAMKSFAAIMSKSSRMDFVHGRLKNAFMKMFGASLWGKHRDLPTFSQNSFRQQWKKK